MAESSAPVQTALVAALTRAGECLTLDALETATGLNRHGLSMASAKLVRAGWVERIERGCYRLTEAG
ncbi:MAG: IclR family transcriptional regulator, partial [Alphaproteobacteria bacterium]|nr:IclR family transcriptional regulator [Alphaproteobacteria bacterium]